MGLNVKDNLYKSFKIIWENKVIPILITLYVFLDKFVPLWRLSAYNHSNADDYWMSAEAHFTWVDTHNLFKVIANAFNSAVWLRNNWDGCFLSMFLSALVPVTFNESYYRFTFYLFSTVIILGTVFFMYELCCRLFKMRLCDNILLTLFTLILIFGFSPSVKEAMYWWCGGINYTFFFGVLLFAQAFLIEYMVSGRWYCLAIGSILSFCVGLGNLLSALVSPILLFLELVLIIYFNCQKENGSIKKALRRSEKFIIAFLAGFTGLLLNVFAPGNMIRGGEDLFASSPVEAVFMTIKSSTALAAEYYKKPMSIILLAMLLVVLTGVKKRSFKFPLPFLVIAVSYLIYCAAFTPVVYAQSAFYGRCKEVSYLFLIFLLVFDMIYFAGWLSVKTAAINTGLKNKNIMNGLVIISAAAVLILGNVWSLYFDAAYAVEAIQSGCADNFHNLMSERFAEYYNPEIKDVVVTTIEWYPGIFYHDDDCLEDIAYYFDKESVTLAQ